jgi:hypothetical protein
MRFISVLIIFSLFTFMFGCRSGGRLPTPAETTVRRVHMASLVPTVETSTDQLCRNYSDAEPAADTTGSPRHTLRVQVPVTNYPVSVILFGGHDPREVPLLASAEARLLTSPYPCDLGFNELDIRHSGTPAVLSMHQFPATDGHSDTTTLTQPISVRYDGVEIAATPRCRGDQHSFCLYFLGNTPIPPQFSFDPNAATQTPQ